MLGEQCERRVDRQGDLQEQWETLHCPGPADPAHFTQCCGPTWDTACCAAFSRLLQFPEAEQLPMPEPRSLIKS